MQKKLTLSVVLALACAVSAAQKPAATATITGRVTCADTNLPARLARVVVRPMPAATTADRSAASRTVEARSVQTLLDGSFSIANLGPGTYMVLASMPGYVSPLTGLNAGNEELLEPSEELRKQVAQRVPSVSVESGGTASINISLERGAAVSGTIQFDDGSPASGVSVQIQQRKGGKWERVKTGAGDGMWSGNSDTDDRGNYRIIGLPPLKEAIVEADVRLQSSSLVFGKGSLSSSGGPGFSLTFYSGGALRPAGAKPFGLTTGEERTGEDIVIPVSKIHRLQGELLAKADGRVLNKGSISLLFPDDRSQLCTAMIGKNDDGFSFGFVPEGDYIFKVNSAAEVRYEEIPNPHGNMPPTQTETHVIHDYGTVEVPIHIDGERTGIMVDVPDKAPSAKTVAQQ